MHAQYNYKTGMTTVSLSSKFQGNGFQPPIPGQSFYQLNKKKSKTTSDHVVMN